MRRALGVLAVVATAALVGCGDDAEPDRTIAFLRTSPIDERNQDALLSELAAAGWTEGENLTVLGDDSVEVYADAEAGTAAIDGWREDGVDLIVALSTTSGLTAREAAGDTPVVVFANDPVASGIVTNPRAPEANVTGLSFRVPPDRTLDIARQLGSDVMKVGFLWPADDPAAEPVRDGLLEAAATLGIDLLDESFVGPDEAADGIDALVARGAQVVILANAAATTCAFPEIEAATTAARLPVIANVETNEFAVVVLAPDIVQAYHQVGRQAARLLGGTDVGEVPVEDPGEFHLVIRSDIAERLGLVLSDDLLAQADQVSD